MALRREQQDIEKLLANKKEPQNIEAEKNVLGCAFISKNSLTKICEDLYSDIFYDEKNKKIFDAIKNCYNEKIPIDITTVTEELDKKREIPPTVTIEYLCEVIDSVPTAANIDHYIKIIKDKAVIRNLINTTEDIIQNAYNEGEDITSLLDSAEKKILNVVKERQTSDFIHIRDAIALATENLEKLSQNNDDLTGLETGFIDLNKVTSGLHAGEMIIIAARPGMGKTAFALNIASRAAQTTKKGVAIFNLEMPAEQLVSRMVSAEGGVDSSHLRTGNLSHEDWQRINEANSRLAETNIQIVDDAGITAAEIKAKCRNLANKEEGLALVIIDYLQLVTSGGRRPESRQQEVSDISRSLKTMAMELKVPVIALAQLSRNAEKRENNQPMLADLRESGSIEQDADMVLFINRSDYYKTKDQIGQNNIVMADIIIAKHRKGSTGKFPLVFKLNLSRFDDYDYTDREVEGLENE